MNNMNESIHSFLHKEAKMLRRSTSDDKTVLNNEEDRQEEDTGRKHIMYPLCNDFCIQNCILFKYTTICCAL